MRKTHGFTLLELSIVLVIIGLVAGGILVGRSLLEKAGLQHNIDDLHNYRAAYTTFHDKYGAIAGDMLNASQYFTGATNGNGDGSIAWATEGLQAWVELAQAGLVEGRYTGSGAVTPGVNVPQSTYNKAIGFSFAYETSGTWNSNFNLTGNVLHVGATLAANTTRNPVLSSDDAKAIDIKLDDSFPSQGAIRSFGSTYNPNCTTGAAQSEIYANPNVTAACSLLIRME